MYKLLLPLFLLSSSLTAQVSLSPHTYTCGRNNHLDSVIIARAMAYSGLGACQEWKSDTAGGLSWYITRDTATFHGDFDTLPEVHNLHHHFGAGTYLKMHEGIYDSVTRWAFTSFRGIYVNGHVVAYKTFAGWEVPEPILLAQLFDSITVSNTKEIGLLTDLRKAADAYIAILGFDEEPGVNDVWYRKMVARKTRYLKAKRALQAFYRKNHHLR